MKRILFSIPLVIFALLISYLIIGLQKNPHYRPSTLLNRSVPSFQSSPLYEEEQGLSNHDLIGQPSVVNFFASWCVPCRVEHPILLQLAEQFAIPIYSINYKDHPQEAQRWLNHLGNPYHRIGIDPQGQIAIQWGVSGIPETFIVDHNGHIRYKHIGPIHTNDVQETIGPLLRHLRHQALTP